MLQCHFLHAMMPSGMDEPAAPALPAHPGGSEINIIETGFSRPQKHSTASTGKHVPYTNHH